MKTQNTLGIIFYLKKYKAKDGKAPLYVRITVDGKRTDIALKRKIEIEKWSDKGLAKGRSEDIRALNTFLERLRGRLIECYQELQINKVLISATAVKNRFLGIDEKEHTLLNLIDYHNKEMINILEEGTLKNYRTHHKPCGQNTIMKHIERLRKTINLAIKNEWLEKDPFVSFTAKYIKHIRGSLTEEELARIEKKNFKIERVNIVRDIFVFSCYTGLSYIDVFELSPEKISLGIDKNYWIVLHREKSDQPTRIPLLPKALEIIEKYKSHPKVLASNKVLPVLSNQKMNSYLKEIADLCGIEKNLTFHLARHTFSTTVTLSNDVPIFPVLSFIATYGYFITPRGWLCR